MKKKTVSARAIAVTAMLSAAAWLLMFIEAPIPALMPGFVKMDVSDLPELLGAFALGPVYGAVIAFLKNLLHILIPGTSTAYVGELFSFGMGAVFAVGAGAVYRRKKSRKAAFVGSVVGAALMAVLSVPFNYFVTYPAYAVLYGGMDKIIHAYQSILPAADDLLKCLVIFNLPWTFCKGMLNVLLCFLIYKPLSPVLHGGKR